MHARTSRRRFLQGAAATCLAGGLTPFCRPSSGPDEIVFATWGGSWERAMREAWFEPFTEETGIHVRTVSDPSYGRIRAMVESGRTEWDVVEVNPDFQWVGARAGLLEPLDFDVIDTSEIPAGEHWITDYSVPGVVWSRVMVYNTDAFPREHPRDWAEVWDVARFPGKRAFYTKANGGTLEIALMADGVAPNELYPLDVDRALNSLDRIADHVIWYDTNAQAVQLVMDERVVLGSMADGRALFAIDQGAPLAIEYNQSQLTWTNFVVPKGAPHRDGAMRLIRHMVSVEAQAAIALAYTYGPVTPRAYELIPEERASILSGGPRQRGKYVLNDERWWSENLERVAEKLYAWRLG